MMTEEELLNFPRSNEISYKTRHKYRDILAAAKVLRGEIRRKKKRADIKDRLSGDEFTGWDKAKRTTNLTRYFDPQEVADLKAQFNAKDGQQ